MMINGFPFAERRNHMPEYNKLTPDSRYQFRRLCRNRSGL